MIKVPVKCHLVRFYIASLQGFSDSDKQYVISFFSELVIC